MKTRLLVGIPFLAVVTITLGQDAAVMERLRHAVNEARDAQKSEYVQARNRLLVVAKDTPAGLTTIRQTTNAWDAQLVCDIALEHLQRSDAIAKAIHWRPERVRDRVASHRIAQYGKMLAEQGKDVPYLLVEKLWRGNEWKILDGEDEETAFVANAIGVLRIQEARRPLELLLKHPNYETRQAVAVAIGKLRSPDSVEPLLDFIMDGFQGRKRDISDVAACDALAQCATRDSLPLLQETLRKVEKGDLGDQANELKSLLKLLIMGLAK